MQLSEEEKQKLRDNGFSEEDIAAYEQDQSQQAAPAPVSPEQADTGLPKFSETEIPATTPPPEASTAETALGVAPILTEALPYIGGGAGVGVLGYAGKKYAEGKKAQLQTEEMRQKGMMEREEMRQRSLNERQQMRMQQGGPRAPVQPGGPGQPPVQGGFQRGQFNMPQQPNMQTGMPSDVRLQQGQMAQPDKMTIFRNPNAGNYIERMSELSKTYGPAQEVVQPKAQPQSQPQPKPSGFPRGTFRGGGGGGGGGGAMVFDPTQRRKPLQF
jgi:hypothetical protein